jgi:hypothetical protein
MTAPHDHKASWRRYDTDCTVRVENTFDSLEAHIELDDNPDLKPGDKVKVHGDPIAVPYGESLVLRRRATVVRATALERALARVRGDLDVFEMFEVSFTSGRTL